MGLPGGGNFDPDRAQELATLAESDPQAAAEHVDELADMLGASRDDIRNAAAYSLSLAAEPRPRRVATVVDPVREVLDDGSSDVRANATWCLSRIAVEYPEEVYPALSQLKTRLRDTETEDAAISAFIGLSDEYPTECESIAEDAIRLLEHREAGVRSSAAYVTWNLGKVSPGLIRRAVDPCLGLLTDDNDYVRHNAVGTLGQIATGYPGDVEPGTDRIAELLEDPKQSVQTYAAWTLSNIAVEYPERVGTAASGGLVRLLTVQGIDVRRYATYAVVSAAVQTPSAVTPTDEAITGLEAVRGARVLDIDSEMIDQAIAALESSPSVDTSSRATRQQSERDTQSMTDAIEQRVTEIPESATESDTRGSTTRSQPADTDGVGTASTVAGDGSPTTTETRTDTPSATTEPAEPTRTDDPAAGSGTDDADSNDDTEVFTPGDGGSSGSESSSQFCPHCGEQLPAGAGPFCGYCGEELP